MLKPEYLFEDKAVDGSCPLSDYGTLDVVSEGSHLYGEIMWPDGSFAEGRPCVIVFHGYPGSARNDDISHALCRMGCVVMSPHHRGAWGSEGKYLLSHCIEDAVNVAEYARSKEFCERYRVDAGKIFLLGHSMGGCTVLNAAKKLPWLRGVVALTPFDPSYYLDRDESLLKALLEQGKILHSDGVDAIFEDMRSLKDEVRFGSLAAQIGKLNLLFLIAEKDSVAPCDKMVAPLWEKLAGEPAVAGNAAGNRPVHRLHRYVADHGLLGSRNACIRDIAEFVCNVA